MTETSQEIGISPKISREILDNKRFFQISGVVAIIAGGLAILMPHIATIAAEILAGALLVVSGVVSLFSFRSASYNEHLATSIFASIIAIIAGVVMLLAPIAGIFAMATILIVYLLVSGAARLYLSWKRRHADGWLWLAFGGILSILLGILILSGLPGTAFWVLGLILGIDMIFYGVSLLAIVSAANRRRVATTGDS